jgi:hypothetical protein
LIRTSCAPPNESLFIIPRAAKNASGAFAALSAVIAGLERQTCFFAVVVRESGRSRTHGFGRSPSRNGRGWGAARRNHPSSLAVRRPAQFCHESYEEFISLAPN